MNKCIAVAVSPFKGERLLPDAVQQSKLVNGLLCTDSALFLSNEVFKQFLVDTSFLS